MSAYEEVRKADHMTRQATERFGADSEQVARIEKVERYWFDRWVEEGRKVFAPPADILEERIKDAERAVRRDEKKRSKS